MAFLPNIEPVTLLLLLLAERYRFKALLPVYAFVLVEGFIYGIHTWFFAYLYVWTIWVLIVIALRRLSHFTFWAIAAAVFGLLFGLFCSVPTFIALGVAGGIAEIVGGLSFDILHCVGNFVMVLVLYAPLKKLLERVDKLRPS
jgi:energy-coupling factor transport system substrate-specific component